MRLGPGEDIGREMHDHLDQFLRIEQGSGRVELGATEDAVDETHDVEGDWAGTAPAGVWHNVVNTGDGELKLYSFALAAGASRRHRARHEGGRGGGRALEGCCACGVPDYAESDAVGVTIVVAALAPPSCRRRRRARLRALDRDAGRRRRGDARADRDAGRAPVRHRPQAGDDQPRLRAGVFPERPCPRARALPPWPAGLALVRRGVIAGRGVAIGASFAALKRAYRTLEIRRDAAVPGARNVYVRRTRAPHWRLRFDVSPQGRVTRIAFGDRSVYRTEGCA